MITTDDSAVDSKSPSPRTDTERLDWIERKQLSGVYLHNAIHWDGRVFRECIDEAMDLSAASGSNLCSCGQHPATEPHSCPFAEEIQDDDDPEYCTCCEACERECRRDI